MFNTKKNPKNRPKPALNLQHLKMHTGPAHPPLLERVWRNDARVTLIQCSNTQTPAMEPGLVFIH